MPAAARLKHVAEGGRDPGRCLDATLLEGWPHRGRAYGTVGKCVRYLMVPPCALRSRGTLAPCQDALPLTGNRGAPRGSGAGSP